MKATQYLTYLKTILLIVPASLYLGNPTTVHAGDRRGLSVGFVNTRHLENHDERPKGYLTVYSATDRAEDGDLEYYAHSSYTIYTVDGNLFKRVENHMSATDEAPEMVSLPVGSYIVEARSNRDGYIRRLVRIGKRRQTILNLDLD
jgi:hypothetical protein